MITINAAQIREFEKHLQAFASRAYPFATKTTVNSAAFRARDIAKDTLKHEFTLRNTFTSRSIQVNQTRVLVVSQQAAAVGSTAGYMETQEFGGTKHPTHGKHVPIATAASAGQEGSEKRTRLPLPQNKLRAIKLASRSIKGVSRVARNIIAIREAKKFVYLDLGRRRGIFRVRNGKIRMIHDLTHPTVKIQPKPWLNPSVQKVIPEIPDLYERALVFQLRKHKLFHM